MWLVAHMTYSQRVRTDGATLGIDDFKTTPEGHTGGSLNMVPAYAGYLLMDSLDGVTRAWMMGQGHCVAAIEDRKSTRLNSSQQCASSMQYAAGKKKAHTT